MDAEEINNNGDKLIINSSGQAGIPVPTLYGALKRARTESVVTIALYQGEDVIHMIDENAGGKIHYEIRQLDVDDDVVSIPPLETKHVAEVEGKQFDDKIGTIINQQGCELVTMEQVANTLHMRSTGYAMTVKAELELFNHDKEAPPAAPAESSGENTYSLRFVMMFAHLHRISGDNPMIMYFMGKDTPFVIQYVVSAFGSIKCCLAPRCEEAKEEEE